MRRIIAAVLVLLAGSTAASAAPVTVDYGSDVPGYPGNFFPINIQMQSINVGGITVTGSNTINALERNGLGIVGGLANGIVDTDEWIRFSFNDGPAIGVSYHNQVAGSTNGDQLVGERLLEAFSPDGASLGVVSQNHVGTFQVSSLFGDAPIAAFLLRAPGHDTFRVGTVTYTPYAPETSVVPLPFAGPMLLVGLGLLFGVGRIARRA